MVALSRTRTPPQTSATSSTAISLALALGEPYPPAPHRVCSLAPLILAVCACRSCIRRQLASTNCTACRSQAGAAESSRARSACQELTLHRRISLVRVVLSHLSCAECCGWLYACTRFESSGSRARALPPHTGHGLCVEASFCRARSARATPYSRHPSGGPAGFTYRQGPRGWRPAQRAPPA